VAGPHELVQYCPIARGAEIFAERWTPLIIRNLYLGCGSFSEILEGAPGLSRTLLSQRLKQLERLGIVESAPKPDGRGRHYELTPAGHDLFKVCVSLGEWGAARARISTRRRSNVSIRGSRMTPGASSRPLAMCSDTARRRSRARCQSCRRAIEAVAAVAIRLSHWDESATLSVNRLCMHTGRRLRTLQVDG
jgi:DNA-binding HxlR family transcriptional regulator